MDKVSLIHYQWVSITDTIWEVRPKIINYGSNQNHFIKTVKIQMSLINSLYEGNFDSGLIPDVEVYLRINGKPIGEYIRLNRRRG